MPLARPIRGAALVVALLCCSCGPSRKPGKDPPELGTGLLRAEELAGRWHWHHASDSGARRIVEIEDWLIEAQGDSLEGSIHRKVTVLSTDGQPFDCSQSLVYTLEAFYQVEGVLQKGQVSLRESDVKVVPSPCEDGDRSLIEYTGTIARGGLVLTHGAGSQTLLRTQEPTLQPPETKSLNGAWRWTNRYLDPDSGQVRIEREEWQLTQTGRALIGHYDRFVTVFSQDGRPLACGGGSSYDLHDRYAVRGYVDGTRVEMIEIGSDPAAHPCDGSKRRHLDAAHGRLQGDSIVLQWRGRRRQVLSRGAPGPAEKD